MLRLTFWALLLALASTSRSQSAAPPSRDSGAAEEESTESNYREWQPITLLAVQAVRDELAINDVQTKELDEVKSACLAATRTALHEYQNLKAVNEKDWNNQRKAIRQRESEAIKRALERINDILSGKQLNRLNELVLQHEGAMAFARPDIVEKLMLTPSQREKIAEIREEARREGSKWKGRYTGAVDPERREFFDKIHQRATKRAYDVLDAGQRATWTEMRGREFIFSAQPSTAAKDQ